MEHILLAPPVKKPVDTEVEEMRARIRRRQIRYA